MLNEPDPSKSKKHCDGLRGGGAKGGWGGGKRELFNWLLRVSGNYPELKLPMVQYETIGTDGGPQMSCNRLSPRTYTASNILRSLPFLKSLIVIAVDPQTSMANRLYTIATPHYKIVLIFRQQLFGKCYVQIIHMKCINPYLPSLYWIRMYWVRIFRPSQVPH